MKQKRSYCNTPYTHILCTTACTSSSFFHLIFVTYYTYTILYFAYVYFFYDTLVQNLPLQHSVFIASIHLCMSPWHCRVISITSFSLLLCLVCQSVYLYVCRAASSFSDVTISLVIIGFHT